MKLAMSSGKEDIYQKSPAESHNHLSTSRGMNLIASWKAIQATHDYDTTRRRLNYFMKDQEHWLAVKAQAINRPS